MIRWRVADVLDNRLLGTLPVTGYSAPDALTGPGDAEFTIALDVVTPDKVAALRALTEPDRVQILADDGTDRYPWAGIIVDRERRRRDGALTIRAQDWRSWFYTAQLRATSMGTNQYGDYVKTTREQSHILVDLLNAALFKSTGLREPGAPGIDVAGVGETGFDRAAVVRKFDYIGPAVDAIAQRDNGMDWWVEATKNAADPRFVTLQARWAYPERTTNAVVLLRLDSTVHGGNITDYTWPESARDRRPRVTALGEGSPPDQIAATDEDPDLSGGAVLLREQTSGPYSGIVKNAQAFDYARAERVARGVNTQSVTITIGQSNPAVGAYMTGDRARLILRDDWLDVEFAAVRILERTLKGGRGEADAVDLLLDLNDFEIPDQGEGV